MNSKESPEVLLHTDFAPIYKVTIDRIFHKDNEDVSEAWAVLGALWRAALFQKQNRPYATVAYLRKVTHMSEQKVVKGRRLLIELGIIKDIKVREGSKYKYFVEICKAYIRHADSHSSETQRAEDSLKPPISTGSARWVSETPRRGALSTNNNNKVHSRQKIAEGGLLGGKPVVNVYVELARELHRIILTKWKTVVKVNHTYWANELRLLNTKDNIPLDLIKETMVWLEANIHDKYTPHVLSAGSFREKFDKLQANIIATKEEEVLATELDKNIFSSLLENGTAPKVDDNYLLQQIALSNKNYQPFRKNLPTFIASFKRDTMNKGSIQLLLDESFRKGFIQEWYELAGREVNHWEDWGGSLKSYVWSLDSEKVNQWANKRLQLYCGHSLWGEMVSAYKVWESDR